MTESANKFKKVYLFTNPPSREYSLKRHLLTINILL